MCFFCFICDLCGLQFFIKEIHPQNKIDEVKIESLAESPSKLATVYHIILKEDTDLAGMDYDNFDLNEPDVNLCKIKCEQDVKCKAFIYVKPGIQNEYARCWLKYGVPKSIKSDCCTSSIKKLNN